MDVYPDCLKELISQFSTLPGIGKKTAERLSIYMLNANKDKIKDFSSSLDNLKDSIEICKICFCFIENDICHICDDVNRDSTLICVVKEPTDIFLIEKSGFKGKYHVLGGVLSPLDGIGPDELNIGSLVNRADSNSEIVLALNPSIEGDTTCLYISKLLADNDVKITRLARGIPVGGELEYTDDATLLRAMEGRTSL